MSGFDSALGQYDSQLGAGRAETRLGTGTAHAKAILVGEHAVLHGHPAIAVPVTEVGVRVHAERSRIDVPPSVWYIVENETDAVDVGADAVDMLRLTHLCDALEISGRGLIISINNAIPYGRGLGSSAAVALALVRALADLHGRALPRSEQLRLVGLVEAAAHGTASGIDAETVSTPGRSILWFERGQVQRLSTPPSCTAALLVIDSGQPSSTARAVQAVAARVSRNPVGTKLIIDRIGAIVHECAAFLNVGDADSIGAAMTENHALLGQLDLSTPRIDRLVDAATEARALGAKVSGGGQGGCVVALCSSSEKANHVGRALLSVGATNYWTIPLQPVGTRS